MVDESEKNALSSEQIVFDEEYSVKMTGQLDDEKEELIKDEKLESILEKEFLEQDKKLEKALE